VKGILAVETLNKSVIAAAGEAKARNPTSECTLNMHLLE